MVCPYPRKVEGWSRLDWLKLHEVHYCLMPGVRDALAHLPLPWQALTRLHRRRRCSFISAESIFDYFICLPITICLPSCVTHKSNSSKLFIPIVHFNYC